MRAVDIIDKKKKRQELTKEEIDFLLEGYLAGTIPDYQMSAFLMAVYFNNMTKEELTYFTLKMRNSGDIITFDNLDYYLVDKHSTGGVGDKVTVVLGPILAALGMATAKLSGKGLGHTGGTIDKFESIENFKFSLTKEELVDKVYPVVRSTGFNRDNKQQLVKFPHTNETDIYLAYDFGKGYKLLDKTFLEKLSLSLDEILEFAKRNLENLPLKYNLDEVEGNKFYFLNAKDGYDGARVIDKNILDYFYKKIGESYYLGLPHQDVLIIADIKNKKGLEILQKMMVHFFTEGTVPITTITFKYDGEKLESYFIFVE